MGKKNLYFLLLFIVILYFYIEKFEPVTFRTIIIFFNRTCEKRIFTFYYYLLLYFYIEKFDLFIEINQN